MISVIASELFSKAKLCYGGRWCIDALSTVIVMFCFHVFVDIQKCIFYESEKNIIVMFQHDLGTVLG